MVRSRGSLGEELPAQASGEAEDEKQEVERENKILKRHKSIL